MLGTIHKAIKTLFKGDGYDVSQHSQEGVTVRLLKKELRTAEELINKKDEYIKLLEVQNKKYRENQDNNRLWDLGFALLAPSLGINPEILKGITPQINTQQPIETQPQQTLSSFAGSQTHTQPDNSDDFDKHIRNQLKDVPREILRSQIAKRTKEESLSLTMQRGFTREQAERAYQIAKEVVNEN